MGPTLAGFLEFIRNVMQITTTVLPDSSPVIPVAFSVACQLANPQMAQASGELYTLAVYNLAGSNLLRFGQDLPGAANVPGSNPALPFFAFTRQQLGINSFVAGVIQSTSDESTSESILTPEVMKNLQFGDLQYLKDPFGRNYLVFASQVGSLWGLS